MWRDMSSNSERGLMVTTPTTFEVLGLFGEYDHRIHFPEDHEFAIVYGPNGVGKTKVFELIRALSRMNVWKLALVPFRAATIQYADNSRLSVQYDRGPDHGVMVFELALPDSDPESWVYRPALESNTNRLHVGGSEWFSPRPGVWVDQADGETIDEEEFRMRYGLDVLEPDVPEPFGSFARTLETYLIETQRLLAPRSTNRYTTAHIQRRGNVGTAAVSRYAVDLRGKLAEALAANSKTTAALDRTFPRRLLDAPDVSDISETLIRDRYTTQNRKRARLARLSLIGSEPDLPLPGRDLAEWERGVLWTYLEDTERKLETFDSVLEKVELLEEIINKRFLRKQIQVSVEDGLMITTHGGDRIRPEELSSGEQHELIMFYDLLFRVSPGALVMVDEPEISLHVAWQRHFLDDMLRVAQASSIRMLVATHSPQIIGKWRSRTTQIGPTLEESTSLEFR